MTNNPVLAGLYDFKNSKTNIPVTAGFYNEILVP